MRKAALALAAVITLCVSLAACSEPGASAPPSDDAEGSPSASASAPPAVQILKVPAEGALNFAYAAEIFASPDSFAGREYSGAFRITGSQVIDGTMYYAKALIYDGGAEKNALLDFGSGALPVLTQKDIVFARGVIRGKGKFTYNNSKIEALWLTVTGIEKDASKEGIAAQNKQYSFGAGEYRAANGALTAEITQLNFTGSNMVICFNTNDSSLESAKTYYFDIILHQEGYFAWNFNCGFLIDPLGSANYDTVLLPALQSDKDITVELVPFAGNGVLLYEPMVIDIKLSARAEG